MKLSQKQLIESLKQTFKLKFVSDGATFSRHNEGSIWISAESGETASDGRNLFDYYSYDENYIFGIHQEFEAFIEKKGWWCEWYDAGTLFLFES